MRRAPGALARDHDEASAARPKGLISLLNRVSEDVVVLHAPFPNAALVIDDGRWTGAMILAVRHRVPLGSGAGALWGLGVDSRNGAERALLDSTPRPSH
jgi:hypothetical protein